MQRGAMVVVIFHDLNGRILLQNRGSERDLWAFLGGGVESGEKPLDALQREIREEVGYHLDEERDNLIFLETRGVTFEDGVELDCHIFQALFPGFEHFSDSEEVKISELGLFKIQETRTMNKAIIAELVLSQLSDGFSFTN